jgi:DNA-binding transcriptional ArsR family regulator
MAKMRGPVREDEMSRPRGGAATEGLDEFAGLAAILGNRSRLEVLLCVIAEPRSVHEVAEATGLRRPHVSGHLRLLESCGIVRYSRVKKEHVYHAVGARLADPANNGTTLELTGRHVSLSIRLQRQERRPH